MLRPYTLHGNFLNLQSHNSFFPQINLLYKNMNVNKKEHCNRALCNLVISWALIIFFFILFLTNSWQGNAHFTYSTQWKRYEYDTVGNCSTTYFKMKDLKFFDRVSCEADLFHSLTSHWTNCHLQEHIYATVAHKISQLDSIKSARFVKLKCLDKLFRDLFKLCTL